MQSTPGWASSIRLSDKPIWRSISVGTCSNLYDSRIDLARLSYKLGLLCFEVQLKCLTHVQSAAIRICLLHHGIMRFVHRVAQSLNTMTLGGAMLNFERDGYKTVRFGTAG